MEKISEFLVQARERISNPFFISIIISWILWNWRIPLALILYDAEMLCSAGYNNYAELIESEYDIGNMFLFPILSGLVYVIAFPFFDYFIQFINSKAFAWGNKKSLETMKEKGKISVDKYLKLREAYLSKVNEIESVIEKENIILKKNVDLENENATLNEKVKKWESSSSNQNDISYLYGDWDYEISSPSDGKRLFRIHINEEGIHSIAKDGSKTRFAYILFYNKNGNSVTLIRKDIDTTKSLSKPLPSTPPDYDTNHLMVLILNVQKEEKTKKELAGTIDDKFQIRMRN